MDDKRSSKSYKDNCGLKHCSLSTLTAVPVFYFIKLGCGESLV